jgi:hypothetical protein
VFLAERAASRMTEAGLLFESPPPSTGSENPARQDMRSQVSSGWAAVDEQGELARQ